MHLDEPICLRVCEFAFSCGRVLQVTKFQLDTAHTKVVEFSACLPKQIDFSNVGQTRTHTHLYTYTHNLFALWLANDFSIFRHFRMRIADFL